jgi:hypothetical protein
MLIQRRSACASRFQNGEQVGSTFVWSRWSVALSHGTETTYGPLENPVPAGGRLVFNNGWPRLSRSHRVAPPHPLPRTPHGRQFPRIQNGGRHRTRDRVVLCGSPGFTAPNGRTPHGKTVGAPYSKFGGVQVGLPFVSRRLSVALSRSTETPYGHWRISPSRCPAGCRQWLAPLVPVRCALPGCEQTTRCRGCRREPLVCGRPFSSPGRSLPRIQNGGRRRTPSRVGLCGSPGVWIGRGLTPPGKMAEAPELRFILLSTLSFLGRRPPAG